MAFELLLGNLLAFRPPEEREYLRASVADYVAAARAEAIEEAEQVAGNHLTDTECYGLMDKECLHKIANDIAALARKGVEP